MTWLSPVLLPLAACLAFGCSSDTRAQPAADSSAAKQTPSSLAEAPAKNAKPASAKKEALPSYDAVIEAAEEKRQKLRATKNAQKGKEASEKHLIGLFETLTERWLGTRWGLGLPQSSVPQVGKINCGTFVGTILEDMGFVVNVRKLQRQPSQLIIKSFIPGTAMKKFSNASMKRFLSTVRSMGPGLFIIGLDFHVGFLLQTEDELRFIHASFETETVVNEDAATAMPITTSAYKVVGKILTPTNLEDWRGGRRIKVQGNW